MRRVARSRAPDTVWMSLLHFFTLGSGCRAGRKAGDRRAVCGVVQRLIGWCVELSPRGVSRCAHVLMMLFWLRLFVPLPSPMHRRQPCYCLYSDLGICSCFSLFFLDFCSFFVLGWLVPSCVLDCYFAYLPYGIVEFEVGSILHLSVSLVWRRPTREFFFQRRRGEPSPFCGRSPAGKDCCPPSFFSSVDHGCFWSFTRGFPSTALVRYSSVFVH